jgi:hypothetical protein
MPLIPIEDTFADVITKAQRGYGITDEELLARAEVAPEELAAIRAGQPLFPVLRRLARHLKLSPDALETLARNEAYPRAPVFPRGFAMFTTRHEDMGVNNTSSGTPRPARPRSWTPAPRPTNCSTSYPPSDYALNTC